MSDGLKVDTPAVLKTDDKSTETPKGLTPEELTAALDKRVNQLREELDGKYKAEIAGLNRRNTELEKAVKDKEDTKKTLEDRVRSIEEEAHRKDAELARERLVRQLHAEADKRGLKLDEELPVDKINMTLEEGVEFLERRKTYREKLRTDAANELLSQGHKPGSGITPSDAEGKLPYDPFDTSAANMAKAIKYETERMKKAAAT